MTDQAPQPVQPTQPVQAPAPVQVAQAVQPTQPVQAPAPVQPTQPAQPENPYQSIIDQQNAQIAALMQQNQALNAQVTQMVQSGAQFNGQAQQAQQQAPGFAYPNAYGGVNNPAIIPQPQEFPPVYAGNDVPLSLSSDVDVSLEGLATQIGKKEE